MQRCLGVDFALMVDRMKFWFDESTTTRSMSFSCEKGHEGEKGGNHES